MHTIAYVGACTCVMSFNHIVSQNSVSFIELRTICDKQTHTKAHARSFFALYNNIAVSDVERVMWYFLHVENWAPSLCNRMGANLMLRIAMSTQRVVVMHRYIFEQVQHWLNKNLSPVWNHVKCFHSRKKMFFRLMSAWFPPFWFRGR